MVNILPKITMISSQNGPLEDFILFAEALKTRYTVTIRFANKNLSCEIAQRYAEIVKGIICFSIDHAKPKNTAQALIEACQKEDAVITGVGEKFDGLLHQTLRTMAPKVAGIAYYHEFRPKWGLTAMDALLVAQAVLYANKNLKVIEVNPEQAKLFPGRLYRIGFPAHDQQSKLPIHEDKAVSEFGQKVLTLKNEKFSTDDLIDLREQAHTSFKKEFISGQGFKGAPQLWVCEGDTKESYQTYVNFLNQIIHAKNENIILIILKDKKSLQAAEKELLAKHQSYTDKHFFYGMELQEHQDDALVLADRFIGISGESLLARRAFVANIPTIIQDETCDLVKEGFVPCINGINAHSVEMEFNKKLLAPEDINFITYVDYYEGVSKQWSDRLKAALGKIMALHTEGKLVKPLDLENPFESLAFSPATGTLKADEEGGKATSPTR